MQERDESYVGLWSTLHEVLCEPAKLRAELRTELQAELLQEYKRKARKRKVRGMRKVWSALDQEQKDSVIRHFADVAQKKEQLIEADKTAEPCVPFEGVEGDWGWDENVALQEEFKRRLDWAARGFSEESIQ